jgi:hypothetical protein
MLLRSNLAGFMQRFVPIGHDQFAASRFEQAHGPGRVFIMRWQDIGARDEETNLIAQFRQRPIVRKGPGGLSMQNVRSLRYFESRYIGRRTVTCASARAEILHGLKAAQDDSVEK